MLQNAVMSPGVWESLQKSGEGMILLVTSKGTYLRIESNIFLLTDGSFGAFPLGIGVENYPALRESLAPVPGQKFRLDHGSLRFPRGILSLKPEAPDFPVWNGRFSRQAVTACAEALPAVSNSRSIARLLPALLENRPLPEGALFRVGLAGLRRFWNAADPDSAAEAATELLGLGNGLTPSMDDVLLGHLYVLRRRAGKHPVTAALEQVLTDAAGRTNDISAAFLKAVAMGEPFQRLEQLLRGLSGEIPLELSPMLEVGGSSGSEMVLGALLAALRLRPAPEQGEGILGRSPSDWW